MTGKTGFTGGAGYCYIAQLFDGDRRFIVALLGCGWPPHKTWKWEDVRKLYRYGKEHFFYQEFAFEEKQVQIPLKNGAYKDRICAISDSPGEKRAFRLLVADGERAEAEYELKKEFQAPVREGEAAGRVLYRLSGNMIGVSTYHTVEAAEAWSLSYCMQKSRYRPGVSLNCKKISKILEFYRVTLYYYNRQKLDLLNDSLFFS